MKKLTTNSAILLLIDIIKKAKRHRDYSRVTKMADTLQKLITGENMDTLMRRFDLRESEEQFKQRKRITMHITGTVSQNLIKPSYEIPRSNGIQRVLQYEGDIEYERLNEFEGILNKFWGDMSMDDYLGDRWIDLAYSDPNSFIVYEWGAFDNKKERALPYPFEVSAHEAIYYRFDNNILKFLVVLNEFEKGAGGIPERVQEQNEGKTVRKRYTIYFEGYAITFDELDDETAEKLPPNIVKEDYKEGAKYIDIKGRTYAIGINDSGLDFIPAIRVGFRRDLATRARTCISPINEAIPILMKTIKANSEFDLTMALHAHPQRLQYLPECEAENCNGGRLPGGDSCLVCKGTGLKQTPTTAQESITLKMPRDKEDIVALDNIVKYVSPVVELAVFQEGYISRLTYWCKEAIYNSMVFTRKEIAETATGANIDLQYFYTALYPMAKAFAKAWGFSVMTISGITDMTKDLTYKYIVNRDFKMKSLNDLYNDLKLVSDSRADSFVKDGIQDDIARIMYTDNPTAYKKYKVMREFYPYSGKSKEEVAMIIATVPPLDFGRILWESYGWIFGELERKYNKSNKNFYDLNRSLQWGAIQKEVEKIIKSREEELPNIREDEKPTE
ncbi:hypothetical protein DRQ25_16460 [Candidatus Fermentibacteria bacterium]|nr:MAG: hypothetical protein DRQ25_16460 [Candidatus Fermentibacteria bacterium]